MNPSMYPHHARGQQRFATRQEMAPQKGTTIHHTPPAGAICPADGLKLIYRRGWFGGFNPGEV